MRVGNLDVPFNQYTNQAPAYFMETSVISREYDTFIHHNITIQVLYSATR